MKTDVMNVKDWLIFFGKFLIPVYNIYWFILCVTGNEKVNVNERNYTLACTLFCAVWFAICGVIVGFFAILLGASVPALLSEDSKPKTEVSSNYDYENNSNGATFEDTEAYNDYTESADDYSTSEETSVGSVEPESETPVDDEPVEDTQVTGEAVIEAEQFGVHFSSNIPLVLDDFDDNYYSYTMDMAYSGYLSVTLYNFEDFTMEEAQDSGKEYTTLSNGVVVNYDEELETITGYVDKGNSIVQIRIYYNEETKETANSIINSITF